jgi:hypothetical protein
MFLPENERLQTLHGAFRRGGSTCFKLLLGSSNSALLSTPAPPGPKSVFNWMFNVQCILGKIRKEVSLMHFGFHVSRKSAAKWVTGQISDAQLLLEDDYSPKDYYWVGSVKTKQELWEVRRYSAKCFVFRTGNATIIEWCKAHDFQFVFREADGWIRIWGKLT